MHTKNIYIYYNMIYDKPLVLQFSNEFFFQNLYYTLILLRIIKCTMIHPRGAHNGYNFRLRIKIYDFIFNFIKTFLINVLLACSSLGSGSIFTIFD